MFRLLEIQSEFNLNYLSVVATIAAFIPHLKKLAVSISTQLLLWQMLINSD